LAGSETDHNKHAKLQGSTKIGHQEASNNKDQTENTKHQHSSTSAVLKKQIKIWWLKSV